MKTTRSKPVKSPIRQALIVHRPNSPVALNLSREVALWLEAKGLKILSHPKQNLGAKRKRVTSNALKKIDLVIVIGGDGTYLEAVRLLKGHQIPILGINMGSLGFLTVVRADDAFQALELTLNGKMEPSCRSLLDIQVLRGRKVRLKASALNDLVIERGPQSQLLHVLTFAGERLVSPIKADGLIVATPTGSTAYNLAAGGPILHPDVSAFVLTPICAHSLTNRPLIFPDHVPLQFRLHEERQTAMLTVDGRPVGHINALDQVLVKREKHQHMVLRQPNDSYFDLLREKLKFGERA